MPLNSIVTVISPRGNLTPFAVVPSYRRFRVVGIFESGFYDFDAKWAYTSLAAAQQAMSLEDVANSIELRLDNLLIGVVGSAAGLVAGYTICYFADRYRWLRLDDQIYALSYVPFQAHAIHGVWIAGAAILVSFLATIYPARSAMRIVPVEVLRYE